MPKKLFLLTLLAFLTSEILVAQTRSDSLSRPEQVGFRKNVGLNMTPLVTQLIPLNRSNPREAGPYLIHFKAYGPRNRYAFRFSAGFHLVPDGNGDLDDPQLNIAMGWEKRRSLGGRWAYTRGFDFVILGGDLNVPGNNQSQENGFLGGGPVWGIEYFIQPRISIGTEASLIMGLVPDFGFAIDFIPPVGLFLNHYF